MTANRIDLEERASDCLSEAIYNMTTYDRDQLEETARDQIHIEAENAVIYYSDAQDLINEYETHRYAPRESDMGGTFRADQWQEAIGAWAYEVVSGVLYGMVGDLLEEVDEKAEALADEFNARDDIGDLSIDSSDLAISLECPHGWAAHDREDSDGVMFWERRQLDGMNAIAVDAGPFWLSYTWTPEATKTEDEREDA